MAQTPNSSIVKKYLEIGLKYKQTHVVGRNLGQNVWCTCNNFQNCIIGFKNMSKKPNFLVDLLILQKIYFIEKDGD